MQIVTIHKVKGLEYPVTFCPFLWDGFKFPPGRGLEGCEYHDDEGNAVVDYRSAEDRAADPGIKARIDLESAAESLRLIYVALTRASHRCYVVAGCYGRLHYGNMSSRESTTSLLNWLVAGDGVAAEAWLKGGARPPEDIEVAWERLAQGSASGMSMMPLPMATGVPLTPQRPSADSLSALTPPARIADPWRISSFSGLANGAVSESAAVDHDAIDSDDVLDAMRVGDREGTRSVAPEDMEDEDIDRAPHDVASAAPSSGGPASPPASPPTASAAPSVPPAPATSPALPNIPVGKSLSFDFGDAPVAGALPAPVASPSASKASARRTAAASTSAPAASAPTAPGPGALPREPSTTEPPAPTIPPDDILRFPRGIAAGDCLHAALERVDFTDPSGWSDAIGFALAGHPVALPNAPAASQRPQLRTMMSRMIADVAHTELADGFRLDALTPDRRLAELEFNLPAHRLSANALNAALKSLGYPVDRLTFSRLDGYLKGFIDLVFEHGGRYYVLDWKSNHLGNTPADYGPAALDVAMAQHGYHLQSLLYSIALTRYLKLRIPGYRHDKHFGGALYLFIRGVRPDWKTAEGKSTGVHFHRPEEATLARLEALLAPHDVAVAQ